MKKGRFDRLLLWRKTVLLRRVSTLSATDLAESLSVEGLPYEEIPWPLRDDVTLFRHLRTDARIRAASSFLTRKDPS